MILHPSNAHRSIDNSWAKFPGNAEGVPAGLIIDLQVTLKHYTALYLTGVAVADGVVSVYIRTADNTLVCWCNTNTTGIPIAMDCAQETTANIVLGYIPTDNFKLSGLAVQINPELISCTGDLTSVLSNLKVIQDGITTYDDELSENVVLTPGDGIDYQSGEVVRTDNLVAKSSVSEKAANTRKKLYRINNVSPDSAGVINIDISVNGTLLPAHRNGLYVYLNSSADLESLRTGDPIDKYLAPEAVRDYLYLPLDDAYFHRTSESFTVSLPRNAVEALTEIYTPADLGGSVAPTLESAYSKYDETEE